MTHASVVRTVGQSHNGLVPYNNGFAAGPVAAIPVPAVIALQRPPAGGDKDSG